MQQATQREQRKWKKKKQRFCGKEKWRVKKTTTMLRTPKVRLA